MNARPAREIGMNSGRSPAMQKRARVHMRVAIPRRRYAGDTQVPAAIRSLPSSHHLANPTSLLEAVQAMASVASAQWDRSQRAEGGKRES